MNNCKDTGFYLVWSILNNYIIFYLILRFRRTYDVGKVYIDNDVSIISI